MNFDSGKATSIPQKSAKHRKYSEPTKTFFTQILLSESKKNAENFFCSRYTIVLANNRKKHNFGCFARMFAEMLPEKVEKK